MDYPVFFTSDLTSAERKISPGWTLAYLKKRLEPTTGISAAFQLLQYYPDSNSNKFTILTCANEEDTLLEQFAIVPYSRIHVEDTDPDSKLSQLFDETSEPGFQLSEEEYARRKDSVLQWKKDQQLGRYDPLFEQAQQAVHLGDRCRVINIEGERRGEVKFVGKISVLDDGKSPWIGIEFDEPAGKNDGLIGDQRFFQAKPGHGSFVRPNKVEVGDFPELDPFESDEEEL
ncbi:hypothetical protein METBIDRAFT_79558 [Metschnikowia bicuspidata var. bicuspidata NRRL YB-4993]|uniref:CAP-Gly domain-containing protein n=1 Tax=Metschnikowia bicuspidata var. bicuspidata NRRL YB-4993 TaxID=869754 RepID=A0A1A0H6L2_9ASCO|nr:hypothetical protein METBIDRAFT_79558 [Metschnikowia bicuspidata var. bicuspidata NRRL YB-4993]OBA19547.1 hypothetical protein METBIDRAFT_79558 [Metschnikowia bicuspidata var. bicuspidata NRRL YB-4993]